MCVYTKVYKHFELLSVFRKWLKRIQMVLWCCFTCGSRLLSEHFIISLSQKNMHLKRQQDHVMSFRAWAAFYKLRQQKSAGCQHTKSKLSQMAKSWEQRPPLSTAHCAKLQFCRNFIRQTFFKELHLTGATSDPWGLILSILCLFVPLTRSSYSKETLLG